jgi:nucleotide-binding universal stress UspA family protein
MKTILVGYDESEAAERALTRAADVAEAFGARLLVASVARDTSVPVPVPALESTGTVLVPSGIAGSVPAEAIQPLPGEPATRPPEPKELARRRLEHARMALAPRRLNAEYVAEVGDPADTLLALAERHDADLIVVGSREHGFLERLLGRSVDETVARRSDRDVLLVHEM